jgi:hypothetical protein
MKFKMNVFTLKAIAIIYNNRHKVAVVNEIELKFIMIKY